MLNRPCNVRLWLSEPARQSADATLFPLGECVLIPGHIASEVQGGFMVRLNTPASFPVTPGGKPLMITIDHWYVFAPAEDIFP